MDAQAPQIEIVYTEQQKNNPSSEPGKRKKSFSNDEFLVRSPKTPPSTPKAKTPDSSSEDQDPLGSFRDVSDLADSIINESLQKELDGIKTKFREVQSLYEQTKKDHLDVLNRILLFHEEKKQLLAFNTSTRQDIGYIKKDISSHAELIQQLKKRVETTEINCSAFNSRLETMNSTNTILEVQEAEVEYKSSQQLIEESKKLLDDVNKSPATELMMGRIVKLELQQQQLAEKQAEKITVDHIVSTPRSPKRKVLADEEEEITLEKTLTQFQEDLENLKKLEKQVTELLTVKKDLNKLTNDTATEKNSAAKKITELENRYNALDAEFGSFIKRVRIWTTLGLASFAACFWILWHTHKK